MPTPSSSSMRSYHELLLPLKAGAESEYVETDIKDEFLNGDDPDKNWKVVTPAVASEMGAIGYVFGSQLQRALQIPIGTIDNARSGASLESLVPRHKFADHPAAKAYPKWVDDRRAAFSEPAFLAEQMRKYEEALKQHEKQIADDQEKGRKVNRRKPNKPDGSIRTWSVPGRSPSDAAAYYNGMFGVFKGLSIKGAAFHQGFINSMMNTSCNPKFYRLLMKLMVQGWREDFKDPHLPVAVIGLCAGGQAQTALNFELESLSTASYIRELQRLGLADVQDAEHTAYIPSDDQRIPQLHPQKKKEFGLRAARWALKTVYGMNIIWDTANLVSAEPEGPALVLTIDRAVFPDNMSAVIEGFSIADRSGTYFMANASIRPTKDKALVNRQIIVSSPLVTEPVSARFSWARGPMGNLKVDGKPWQPLHSFRTDNSDFSPEVSHLDPDGPRKNAEELKKLKEEAAVSVSVFDSLCRGAAAGNFQQLADRDDLWRLLVAIAGQKAVDQIRRQTSQKRGGGDVHGDSIFAQPSSDGPQGFEQFLSSEPTPEFLLIIDEQQDRLFGLLKDDTQRDIARLRLEGFSNEEVAEQLGISIRTVERKFSLIRDAWSKELGTNVD